MSDQWITILVLGKDLNNYQSPVNPQNKDFRDAIYDATKKKIEKREIQDKTQPHSLDKPNQVSDTAKLLQLLQSIDVEELETALSAIKTAKEQSPNQEDEDGYKFYKEKCLVY